MGSLFSRKKPEPAKTQTQSATEEPASGQPEPKDTAVPPSGPPIANDIAFIDEDADDDSSKVTQEIQNPEDNVHISEEPHQEDEKKEKSIHTVTFNLPEKKDESAAPLQIDDIKCEVPVATENVAQVPKSSGDSDIEISTELPVESEPSQTPSVVEGFKVIMSHSPTKTEPEILKEYQNDIETLEFIGEDKTQSKVETLITLERPSSIIIPEAEKVMENASPSPKFETKVEMLLQPSTPTQEEVITLQQDASNEVQSQEHTAQLDTHSPEKSIEVSQSKIVEQTDIKEKHSENVKVAIVFAWEQGGSEVFVGGSFNNWEDLIAMELSDNKHEAKVEMCCGTHYYKFFVDGNWTVNINQPIVEIPEKGQVNQIEVKA